VLPYLKREPTYSGSSTRFYEHLAACRPILATDGFSELLHKEPLLTILRTSSEWLRALHQLRDRRFCDGLEERRWKQSQSETWEMRAQNLLETLRSVDKTSQNPTIQPASLGMPLPPTWVVGRSEHLYSST
jgi:hypothetical protein